MIDQSYIEKTLKETLSSDAIKTLIHKKVSETVKYSIETQFRSYEEGNIADYIKQEVAKTVSLNFDKIKIPDFQAMIIENINDGLEAVGKEELKKLLEKNIKKMLVKDTDEISITELMYMFLKEYDLLPASNDYYSCDPDPVDLDEFDLSLLEDVEMSLYFDESEKFEHIYFDKKEGKSKYSCGFQIDKYKNEVYGVHSSAKISMLETIGDFEMFLFKLNSQSVRLTISESEKRELRYISGS